MHKYSVVDYNQVSDGEQSLKDGNVISTTSHSLSESITTIHNNNENINASGVSPKLPSSSELYGHSTLKEGSTSKEELGFPYLNSAVYQDVTNDVESVQTSDYHPSYRNQNAHGKGNFESEELCWFYSDHGYCRYGRNCKYIHKKRKKAYHSVKKNIESDSAISNAENSSKDLNLTGKFQGFELGNKDEVCDPLLFNATNSDIADSVKISEQLNFNDECIKKVSPELPSSSELYGHSTLKDGSTSKEELGFPYLNSAVYQDVTNDVESVQTSDYHPSYRNQNAHGKGNFESEELCWFYSDHGYCRYGRNCKYIHKKMKKAYHSVKKNIESDSAISNAENSSKDLNLTGKFQGFELGNKDEVCDPLLFNATNSDIADSVKISEQLNFNDECIKKVSPELPSSSELYGHSTLKEGSTSKEELGFPYLNSAVYQDVTNDVESVQTSDYHPSYRNQNAHGKGNFESEELCWFYSDHGYCRYGRNCKYIHRKRKKAYHSVKQNIESDSAISNAENSSKDLNLTGKFQGFELGNKDEVCDPLLFNATNSGIADSVKISEQLNFNDECIKKSFKENKSIHSNSQQHTLHQEIQLNMQKSKKSFTKASQKKTKISRNSKQEISAMKKYSTVTYSSTNSSADMQKRICFYYKEGFCHRGDKCKFWHPVDFTNQTIVDLKCISGNESEMLKEEKALEKQPPQTACKEVPLNMISLRIIPNTRQALLLEHLNENNLCTLRKTEIEQLKKRFPKHEVSHGDSKDIFECQFSSSDPDWPFDIKTVVLEVTFGNGYPKEVCEIQIVNKEKTLPPLLSRHLDKCIKEWLTERHQANLSMGKVELVFRPFLIWLDRNLQDLFIVGLRKVKQDLEARAAGIEFIPYEDLPGGQLEQKKSALSQKSEQQNVDKENSREENCRIKSVSEESEIAKESNNLNYSKKQNLGSYASEIHNEKEFEKINLLPSANADQFSKHNIPKRGTEIKLQELELKEDAAALTCQKIAITVQCSRCKTRHEISSPARRNNVVSCTKCHHDMQVALQPAMLHQYSAVLGYLHLVACQAVDIPLMKCDFLIDCLNCSKQITVNGIHYGQQYVTWCLFCNKKLAVCVQSVKFQQLQPAQIIGTGHRLVVEKKTKKIKDPAIQEGMPLPNSGSCKHYKKSYRWLRFPCCGKAYPCDVCHNEKETDHEMKFANHMICGFCAKEQPYSSDRPCISCAYSMTKKSGTHWEGGKGCRDRIKMSREDRQKYSGMSKTTSRKAQDLKPKKK